MVRPTFITGIVLLALGLGGYVLIGMASPTALIPAGFGVLYLVAAQLAGRENLRRHMMHAAAGLSMVGVLATIRALPAFVVLLGGGDVERPSAVIAQTLMTVTCLVHLALSIRSFVRARLGGGQSPKEES